MTTALTPVKQIESLLMQGKKQIMDALPKFINSERFVRVALTEVRNNPQIQKCDPISVCTSIMKAAQLGLDIGGTLSQAYLVPFYSKRTGQWLCQMIPGYRGLVLMVRRTGDVSNFFAQCVYKGDDFNVSLGTDPKIHHVPGENSTDEMTHVYAVCVFKDGTSQFDVMTRKKVEAHRDRYSKSAEGDAWKDAFEEMAKKTIVRRLIKMLPISIEEPGMFNDAPAAAPQVHDPEKIRELQNAPDIVPEEDRDVYLKMIEHLSDEMVAKQIPSDEILKLVPADYMQYPADKLVAVIAGMKGKLGYE